MEGTVQWRTTSLENWRVAEEVAGVRLLYLPPILFYTGGAIGRRGRLKTCMWADFCSCKICTSAILGGRAFDKIAGANFGRLNRRSRSDCLHGRKQHSRSVYQVQSPVDGIGIHACLRNTIFRVRLSDRAPNFCKKDKTQVWRNWQTRLIQN